ncbi:MAG: hypothetical protein AB1757_06735 [Acidobacteriota bacterium]
MSESLEHSEYLSSRLVAVLLVAVCFGFLVKAGGKVAGSSHRSVKAATFHSVDADEKLNCLFDAEIPKQSVVSRMLIKGKQQ